MEVKQRDEEVFRLADGSCMPKLAFGLYKVPKTKEGEDIIDAAIAEGYRHFDAASIYANEECLGRCIQRSSLPRKDFFIASKVWNDAQKEGRNAVRESVEKSIQALNCGVIDLLYIHWPVPGHFIDTYLELQEMQKEGKIKNIGISNFGIDDYESILKHPDVKLLPAVNQIEVSPFMYRPKTIDYFQRLSIVVAASKSLHRATGFENSILKDISQAHAVEPSQVMIRWGLQKDLCVIAKTSSRQRMRMNRDVISFILSEKEMAMLDSLTSEADVKARDELEAQRKIA